MTRKTAKQPPARRRNPEVRPQQILDAAFREFATKGLAGARLDDIAKGASVAKGTIYLYFPNKEALFREMVTTTIISALEEREARLDASADDTAEVQLRALAIGWWAFLRTERFQVVYRLVQAELHQFPDLMAFFAESVVARSRRLISRILIRGIANGEFRPIDPESGARMLSSLTIMHSTWCARRQFFPVLRDLTDDGVIDEILDFYLHGLRPDAATVRPIPVLDQP